MSTRHLPILKIKLLKSMDRLVNDSKTCKNETHQEVHRKLVENRKTAYARRETREGQTCTQTRDFGFRNVVLEFLCKRNPTTSQLESPSTFLQIWNSTPQTLIFPTHQRFWNFHFCQRPTTLLRTQPTHDEPQLTARCFWYFVNLKTSWLFFFWFRSKKT